MRRGNKRISAIIAAIARIIISATVTSASLQMYFGYGHISTEKRSSDGSSESEVIPKVRRKF